MEKNGMPFVLPRKASARYKQIDAPKIRVTKETYELAAMMAVNSGLSLTAVVGRAMEYAAARVEYVEE